MKLSTFLFGIITLSSVMAASAERPVFPQFTSDASREQSVVFDPTGTVVTPEPGKSLQLTGAMTSIMFNDDAGCVSIRYPEEGMYFDFYSDAQASVPYARIRFPLSTFALQLCSFQDLAAKVDAQPRPAPVDYQAAKVIIRPDAVKDLLASSPPNTLFLSPSSFIVIRK